MHHKEPAYFYCITILVVCSCFDVCWSFGVAGWGGIRVADFSLLHGYHPNPYSSMTEKYQLQNTSSYITEILWEVKSYTKYVAKESFKG